VAQEWSERILGFPVRTAALDSFVRDLKAHGYADAVNVEMIFGEGSLCLAAEQYWLDQGWVQRDPGAATRFLAGPQFSRELSVAEFAGSPESRDEFVRAPVEPFEAEIDEDSRKETEER
jgi:hypothetical protein